MKTLLLTEEVRTLLGFLICHGRSPVVARMQLAAGGIITTFEGDFSMQLPDNCQVHASVSYVDAKGNPAPIDGAPVWATDRTDLLNVVANADGSVDIAAVGPLGTAQVSVTADVDLGAGVEQLVTLGTIEVIGSKAVSGVIDFGAPTEVA